MTPLPYMMAEAKINPQNLPLQEGPLETDFRLESYDFDLPEDQIAQFPPEKRGETRLMTLGQGSEPKHDLFASLPRLLPASSLLIANNSRVVSARLIGKRAGGGKAEFLLLTPLPLIKQIQGKATVEGLIRPAARIKPGATLDFGPAKLEILAKQDFGRCTCQLYWQGDLEQILAKTGFLPLPPYIRRAPNQTDQNRYQTVYASKSGSVAAPTAGLHFTSEMIERLKEAGHDWAELSLHVGYGTFSPVRSQDIRQHEMHSEYVELTSETALKIKNAMQTGRPIIAIGTTSARCLEGVFASAGEIKPYSGMINIFIYPGIKFQVISGLLTNFHLPRSSLLMLVSAFAGRERLLNAYKKAVTNKYRFFSYGDAMLLANK